MTHICVDNLSIIASDDGLSPRRHQDSIWTNCAILLIRTLGSNFSQTLTKIQTFSFKKKHCKLSSAKKLPFCLGLNVTHFIIFTGRSTTVSNNGIRISGICVDFSVQFPCFDIVSNLVWKIIVFVYVAHYQCVDISRKPEENWTNYQIIYLFAYTYIMFCNNEKYISFASLGE